mmetsp:Transcript_20374/g.56768  ORF Transcript_20374/g.56768 Transcript_20374/m.56768 type:complete len:133 (+) Transcript_20374:956-1354(+)
MGGGPASSLSHCLVLTAQLPWLSATSLTATLAHRLLIDQLPLLDLRPPALCGSTAAPACRALELRTRPPYVPLVRMDAGAAPNVPLLRVDTGAPPKVPLVRMDAGAPPKVPLVRMDAGPPLVLVRLDVVGAQ